jgi:hypothetical protein
MTGARVTKVEIPVDDFALRFHEEVADPSIEEAATDA